MKELFTLKEAIGSIRNPSDLFKKIKRFKIDYYQENFIVFYLNTKSLLIGKEVVFKGGMNAAFIDPKVIFRKALIKKASSIIIAHNHPSGDLSPSEEDIDIFNKLKQVGKILNLFVLDSIIFNKKEFYSMK